MLYVCICVMRAFISGLIECESIGREKYVIWAKVAN